MTKDDAHALFEVVSMLYILHRFYIAISEVNKLTV